MRHVAVNPYLPGWEYIPDGEPHVFGDRVYVFGSHDAPGGTAYCQGDYVCWSAPVDDLGCWHYEGVIFRKRDDPDYVPVGPGDALEMGLAAPDVCQGPDGRFYLYYFLSFEYMAVAVCDTPAGHYRYVGRICLPDGAYLSPRSGYGMPFDPAVYVEGQDVWFYYGFGVSPFGPAERPLGGYVARLEPDMRTMAEEPHLLVPGPEAAVGTEWAAHPFFEASSMRLLDGRYYFVYSSTHGHELCYGVADAPDAVPAFGGVLVSNGDVGLPGHEDESQAVNYIANNHGGLVRIGKETYVFYHRHTHGMQYSRQGCAEKVQILDDGRIPQVEVTSCGLNGGPLPAAGEYPAHICCALHGAAGTKHYSSRVKCGPEDAYVTQDAGVSTTDTQTYVHNLQEGAGCGFKYFQFGADAGALRLEVRGTFAGVVEARLDAEDGSVAASVAVEPSEEWAVFEAPLAASAGTHALYLTFAGEGTCDLASVAFE